MKIKIHLLITFLPIVFSASLAQNIYNYDEVWNGKPEAISASDNNNSYNIYTEVYNPNVSPFADPNWQQLTNNTIYVQENNFASFSEWGGVDPDMYRDLVGYSGRDRAFGLDPNTATTVNVNSTMSVADIQAVIDAAAANTTIFFEAGTYDFNEALWINKDNLTLRGATSGSGTPLVIIDMFDVADITGTVAAAFDIRKPGVSSIFGNNLSTVALNILETNTTSEVRAEDKTVTLAATDISMIEAGDFIIFSYVGDPFFNERNITAQERLRSVTEIESVNYATKQVTLKTGVGMDYDPNRSVSTNEVLIMEKEDVIRDVVIKNFIFQSFSDASYNAQVDGNDFTNSRADFTNGTSAISARSTHELDIQNITIRNAASNGIQISGGFETYIDDYLFDGAMNNGAGGNGYGFVFGDVFYATVTNFSTGTSKPVRHAFIFAFGTSCGYNNISVPYSNANADMHGGPDYGNIIYFDDIDVRPMDSGTPPIFDYRYEWHPRTFGTYTPPPLNQIQNTVTMKIANAVREGPISGYNGFDNPNDPNDSQANDNDGEAFPTSHTVYASSSGSIINTWGQDDIIVSGTGNDIIDGGNNQDFFVFLSNSGNDVIKSYVNSTGVRNTLADTRDERGFSFRTERDEDNNLLSRGDKIVVKENINNTGIIAPADVLAQTSQNGADVAINLGDGNTITIEDFDVVDLSAEDFVVLNFNAFAPLPITLVDFSARLEKNHVLLRWRTASEINNKGFEVEKSTNAKDWKTIGYLKGNGTTTEEHAYAFLDEDPMIGINYYRLKQIDFDGQFSYTTIRSVDHAHSPDSAVRLYPNPFDNQLIIAGSGIGENGVKVINMLGQDISHMLRFSQATDHQVSITTSSLASGWYFIQIGDTTAKVFKK